MGRLPKNSPTETVNALAEHIGAQLLALRVKHNATMREVAEGTGLSSAAICQIENGQVCVYAITLWRLSQYFGVPMSYWFKGLET